MRSAGWRRSGTHRSRGGGRRRGRTRHDGTGRAPSWCTSSRRSMGRCGPLSSSAAGTLTVRRTPAGSRAPITGTTSGAATCRGFVLPLRYTVGHGRGRARAARHRGRREKLATRRISARRSSSCRGTRTSWFATRGRGASRAGHRLLIGRTDGGRVLALVINWTAEPTTWVVVTGWSATEAEQRKLVRGRTMSNDPWTDPDPQPGDFDAELALIDPRFVESHAGDRGAKLRDPDHRRGRGRPAARADRRGARQEARRGRRRPAARRGSPGRVTRRALARGESSRRPARWFSCAWGGRPGRPLEGVRKVLSGGGVPPCAVSPGRVTTRRAARLAHAPEGRHWRLLPANPRPPAGSAGEPAVVRACCKVASDASQATSAWRAGGAALSCGLTVGWPRTASRRTLCRYSSTTIASSSSVSRRTTTSVLRSSFPSPPNIAKGCWRR